MTHRCCSVSLKANLILSVTFDSLCSFCFVSTIISRRKLLSAGNVLQDLSMEQVKDASELAG